MLRDWHVGSLIVESDAQITALHAQMDMENLHICSNSAGTRDREEGSKMDPVNFGLIKIDVDADNTESAVGINHYQLLITEETKASWKETDDILETSNDATSVDGVDPAELGIGLKSRNALTEEEQFLQLGESDLNVAAGEVSLEIESSEPSEDAPDMNTESSESLFDGGSWEHITNWTENSTEQGQTENSMTEDASDSSTLSASSLNVTTGDTNGLQSDTWIRQRQLIEPELRTDEINLLSCNTLSPGREYMETFDLETADISMVPMESLHLSLASNNNLLLGATGTGPSSLHSMNSAIAGADWHMGSVPVKCLQLGAVNVASLTLGAVGISVIPMVSAGTIDSNPFTESIGMVPIESLDWETISVDSENLSTTYADHVNVDSITPEGVRERWHPLEDRLYALGEALTALDKKLEGFSPRLQDAETHINDMECSLTQHSMHINDIINENTALAQRILQLEEQMRGEKHMYDSESEENA